MTGRAITTTEPKQRPLKPKLMRAVKAWADGKIRSKQALSLLFKIPPRSLSRAFAREDVQQLILSKARKNMVTSTARASARVGELLDGESESVSLDAAKSTCWAPQISNRPRRHPYTSTLHPGLILTLVTMTHPRLRVSLSTHASSNMSRPRRNHCQNPHAKRPCQACAMQALQLMARPCSGTSGMTRNEPDCAEFRSKSTPIMSNCSALSNVQMADSGQCISNTNIRRKCRGFTGKAKHRHAWVC